MNEVKTTVNGVETTLLLNDEDAKAYDKGEIGFQRKRADESDVDSKQRRVANKSA